MTRRISFTRFLAASFSLSNPMGTLIALNCLILFHFFSLSERACPNLVKKRDEETNNDPVLCFVGLLRGLLIDHVTGHVSLYYTLSTECRGATRQTRQWRPGVLFVLRQRLEGRYFHGL